MAAVQAAVAPEMQGRVFTLIQTMAMAMSPIGLIIAGPIADKLGVQTWFIIGGVVTIGMGVIGVFIPAIMHFEDGRKGFKPTELEETALADQNLVGELGTTVPSPAPAKVDYT
jgi:MFS family permease